MRAASAYRGPLISAKVALQMHNLQQERIDALLAENQRLREALQLLYYARFDEEIPAGLWEAAREALAGDAE